MLITAIRTAMPKVTCGRITECLPSATAESISTPRFIGPGCITIASGFASASLSGGQTVVLEEFPGRRQQRALHALVLQAQHHDDVATCETLAHVVEDPHAQRSHRGRAAASCGPIARTSGRAERRQAVDERARDARMQHVADDRPPSGCVKSLLVVADREQIEQALRRMRVAAVAGVDDVDACGCRADRCCGDEMRRADLRVAHDEHVGVHRHQVVDGVEQRLALARRARRRC